MKAKEMQAIMIEKLKDGPKTMGELAEMTGFSKEQVRERMRRAQVEGLVVMNQQGKPFSIGIKSSGITSMRKSRIEVPSLSGN